MKKNQNNPYAFYKAYTHKIYRLLMNIIFPLLFAIAAYFCHFVEGAEAPMFAALSVFLMSVELIGEYIAYGSVCTKDSAPINWLRSSYNGRVLLKAVYGFDIFIKLLKYSIIFAAMSVPMFLNGIIALPLIVAFGFVAIVFTAFNFIRKTDNAQNIVFVMLPSMILQYALIFAFEHLPKLCILGLIALPIIAIIAIIFTYTSSIKAYDKVFHDVEER